LRGFGFVAWAAGRMLAATNGYCASFSKEFHQCFDLFPLP
jgi:hypothetical protein